MLFQTHGTKFFGLTKELNCTRCNNSTIHEIRQHYFSQAIVGIPAGTTNYKIFDIKCPICEAVRQLNLSRLARGRNDAKFDLFALLDDGKFYTKVIVDKMGSKDRSDLFKRMNAIEAYDMVRFLSGH